MPRFEMKLNDHEDHAEWDWLVLEDGRAVQGFASSNAAERWIVDREREARVERAFVSRAEKRRASRAHCETHHFR